MDIIRKIFTGWEVENNVTFGRSYMPDKKLPVFRSITQKRMGHIDSNIQFEQERYMVDLYRQLNRNFTSIGEDYIPASMLENSNYEVKEE